LNADETLISLRLLNATAIPLVGERSDPSGQLRPRRRRQDLGPERLRHREAPIDLFIRKRRVATRHAA
jgi:hypothetical protein